jgi:hypothetical protein
MNGLVGKSLKIKPFVDLNKFDYYEIFLLKLNNKKIKKIRKDGS